MMTKARRREKEQQKEVFGNLSYQSKQDAEEVKAAMDPIGEAEPTPLSQQLPFPNCQCVTCDHKGDCYQI